MWVIGVVSTLAKSPGPLPTPSATPCAARMARLHLPQHLHHDPQQSDSGPVGRAQVSLSCFGIGAEGFRV